MFLVVVCCKKNKYLNEQMQVLTKTPPKGTAASIIPY